MKKQIHTICGRAAIHGLMVLVLGAAPLALSGAEAAKPADKDAEEKGTLEERLEKYNNWLELSFGHLSLSGDKGAFSQRHYNSAGPFGGLEDLHWERDLNKKTKAVVDGRMLFDQQDYKLKLSVTREGLGFVRGGFTAARYWYDGSGGFFPATGAWLNLYDDQLWLDRGEIWMETGLTLKNWPTLTFKYTHQYRDGLKDSTSWGPSHPNGFGGVRGISPAFWDLDETRDIFQGDMKHTIGKTTLGLGVRYDTGKNNDALKSRRFPNEIGGDSYATTREIVSYDVFNAHAYTETRFNPKVFLSAGYSFSTLDNDLAGSRIYGSDYDVGYTAAFNRPLGFYDLSGGSQAKQHVVNLNLMLTPWKNFYIVPSLRLDHVGLDSDSAFTQTVSGSKSIFTGPGAGRSSRDVLDVGEQLEVRYTGITNWVLYGRAELMEGQGDLTEFGGMGLFLPVDRYTKDRSLAQKYTLGANWYALRNMSWSFQYYHKNSQNDYNHITDNTPAVPGSLNLYPAFLASQNFTTDDANVRLTLRPLKNVTLVSRYDIQHSTVDTLPGADAGLEQVQSARILTHVFGQNITWVPWSRLYLQGGFNCVLSKTETPADNYTQSVLDAKNNYWTASLTAGFVVDNKTDLQAQYFYYRAFDNYTDNSAYGVPYGANAKEQSVTATLTRRLRDNVRLMLRYGFFSYRDAGSGGNNNYDAHLLYSSLQIRL